MDIDSRLRINQGVPGLWDISGRTWCRQSRQLRGQQGRLDRRLRHGLKPGRDQHAGHRLHEAKAGAERTCWH